MSIQDLHDASVEIDQHAIEYKKADLYYEGRYVSASEMQTWSELLGEEDFKGVLNYAAIPVDAVADRMQLLSITGPTPEITQMITDLWAANKMQLRFGQFILDVLKYGEHFITVWPEEEEDPTDPGITASFDLDSPASAVGDVPLNHKAKMTFADAATTRAFYDDGGELQYVARKWCQKDADDKDIERVNLYYLDSIEKYWWYSKDKIETAKPWYDSGQIEGDWPMINPYHQIPFFPFSTAFPYGQPEHKSLYGVQDAINEIFQTHIDSIKFLGFPITYMLLDETSASGTSDFEYSPIDQNNQDSAVSDVNRLKNNPGEIWAARAKSIGQLAPAGSTSFLDSLKQYKEMASEISGLPARLFTSTDGQHPGADAQNAADAVLNQRTIDRELLVDESLKHTISFALFLAYGVNVAPKDIVILWKPQKIQVDSSSLPLIELKLKLGMSPRQVMAELGYTEAELTAIYGESDGKAEFDARQAMQKVQSAPPA